MFLKIWEVSQLRGSPRLWKKLLWVSVQSLGNHVEQVQSDSLSPGFQVGNRGSC